MHAAAEWQKIQTRSLLTQCVKLVSNQLAYFTKTSRTWVCKESFWALKRLKNEKRLMGLRLRGTFVSAHLLWGQLSLTGTETRFCLFFLQGSSVLFVLWVKSAECFQHKINVREKSHKPFCMALDVFQFHSFFLSFFFFFFFFLTFDKNV